MSSESLKMHDPERSRRSAREFLWNQKMDELEHLADRLGEGIDNGVKETVAGFNLLDMPTRQSCEGHINEEGGHGHPFPWIDFAAPNEPEEEFVGQNDIWRQVAQTYGVSADQVRQHDPEEAWQEASLLMSNERTSEYIQWQAENKKLLSSVQMVINDFYQQREVPDDVRLTLDFDTLHNGIEDISKLEPQEAKARLTARQLEMKELGDFLKQRFLSIRT